jgi:hypothetical protein
MISLKLLAGVLAVGMLSACASSPFDSSWKAPEATALRVEGAKVAAIAMMENEAARRAAEDALVRELNERGAYGVAMYTIMPEASPGNEAEVRAALDGMGFAGAVVLRPYDRRTEVTTISAGASLGAPSSCPTCEHARSYLSRCSSTLCDKTGSCGAGKRTRRIRRA